MVNIKLQTLAKITDITIDDQQRFFLDGKQQKINVDNFMFHLKNIVRNWEEEYINQSILDGLSFSVTLTKDGRKFTSRGRNKFPDNFSCFLRLIEEVQNVAKQANHN